MNCLFHVRFENFALLQHEMFLLGLSLRDYGVMQSHVHVQDPIILLPVCQFDTFHRCSP